MRTRVHKVAVVGAVSTPDMHDLSVTTASAKAPFMSPAWTPRRRIRPLIWMRLGHRIDLRAVTGERKNEVIRVKRATVAPALVRRRGAELAQVTVRTGREAPILFAFNCRGCTPIAGSGERLWMLLSHGDRWELGWLLGIGAVREAEMSLPEK